MRRLALWLLAATATLAQPEYNSLLLPVQVQISGTVVDAMGNPIPGALIAHANSQGKLLETDAAGRFPFETNAPAVVIEKPGYYSERIKSTGAQDIRVTLNRLSRSFPLCQETGSKVGLDGGFGGAFYFPRTAGIKATEPKWDVDYVARRYSTKVRGRKYWVWHGTGGLWGGGEPFDELVWKSTEYEQATFGIGDSIIVDARGVLPNGNRWHHLGHFGVTASYEDVPFEAAAILDRLLDGACWDTSAKR